MSVAPSKESTPNLLKTTKLKLQIETYKELVKRSHDLVIEEQATFEEKMQNIWGERLDFLEKANSFHGRRGISSPWWNAQVMRMHNQTINQENSAKSLRKKALDNLAEEISKLTQAVEGNEEEISSLKAKITEETAKVLELKKIENELQEEPFGSEFTEMKAKIECGKRRSLQLKAITSSCLSPTIDMTIPQTNLNFRFQPKEPSLITNVNNVENSIGSGETLNKRRKTSKIVKIRERTTFMFRSGQVGAMSTITNDEGGAYLPRIEYDNNNSEDEPYVTHS